MCSRKNIKLKIQSISQIKPLVFYLSITDLFETFGLKPICSQFRKKNSKKKIYFFFDSVKKLPGVDTTIFVREPLDSDIQV